MLATLSVADLGLNDKGFHDDLGQSRTVYLANCYGFVITVDSEYERTHREAITVQLYRPGLLPR